jgi:hypothetical protein
MLLMELQVLSTLHLVHIIWKERVVVAAVLVQEIQEVLVEEVDTLPVPLAEVPLKVAQIQIQMQQTMEMVVDLLLELEILGTIHQVAAVVPVALELRPHLISQALVEVG